MMFDMSKNLLFSVHGGGDSPGGVAGLLGSFLTTIENLVSMSPGEAFASILPGISAMENIHPLFVHFPIVLLTLFFLVDFAGSIAKRSDWRQVASWFLYLGTIFAGMTVVAGLIAAASVMHGDTVHVIMETHKHFGFSILTLATILSIWRLVGLTVKGALQGLWNGLYLGFAALLCLLIVLGADLGGLMVYKYGVGVAAARAAIAEGLLTRPHVHGHDEDHNHEHSHTD